MYRAQEYSMTHESPVRQRLHITFGKFDALKYTSNLDVAKIWERVLRRADLPILYTKGFNTRPRIQLASALPLGITSECEILDVALREPIALDGLVERLLAVSPVGLRIYAIAEVPITMPALQTLVRSAEYRIHLEAVVDGQSLEQRIKAMLASEKMIIRRERKGKSLPVDARPLIYDLHIDGTGDLIAHLAVGDNGNLRPDEILSELGLAGTHYTVHRFRLHLAS
jgi:radical SAM-linked protein